MSTDLQRGVARIGEVVSDPSMHATGVESDLELARLFELREAAIQRIVAQQTPELIQQGVAAYWRDLPRLLAENRYRQLIANPGNELLAFAATDRQLRKRLAKKVITDWGELFVTSIAPLGIDVDDEIVL